MKDYKICVYTICKNETQFVDKWIENMSEADYICVLDTGSSDDTFNKLKEWQARFSKENNKCQIFVDREIINPWRFDVARNESMKLIPDDTDIFVCTDFDEVFEPGWSTLLKNAWQDTTKRASYLYTWSHRQNGENGRTFVYNKIHGKGYKWRFPVHECLADAKTGLIDKDKSNYVWVDKMHLHHYPDQSKSRSSYLPLLELRAKENPDDYFGLIYLCHEYYYREEYQKSIDLINKIISRDDFNSLTNTEKSSCYLFMGDDYRELGDFPNAIKCYLTSKDYDDTLREPYLKIASIMLDNNEFEPAIYYAKQAIKVCKRHYSWLEKDNSWTYEPYDILALASFYGGHKRDSLAYAYKACSFDPDNGRLKSNIKLILDNMSESELIE